MKYILNESPVRTTNGFNVNNVKVDLDLPDKYNFHDYELLNVADEDIKFQIKESYISNIGLNHKEYKNTVININKSDTKIASVKYHFHDLDNLVDNIEINIEKDIESNMLIEYISDDETNHFHNGNIVVNLSDNSKLNLTIVNSLNISSINILSGIINCNPNSEIKINLIDLSGKTRIYNFKSNTNKNAKSKLNNIYIGRNSDLIDLNYCYINQEENSNNNIEVQGMLDDNSKKTFRGIIDFKVGSKDSIGYENEECLLLSNTSISKSLPIILCEEEHVNGTHSVSSGKIDSNKLFYLMSRGLDELDAKKLIINSKFNNIINQLPDNIKEYISDKINKIL